MRRIFVSNIVVAKSQRKRSKLGRVGLVPLVKVRQNVLAVARPSIRIEMLWRTKGEMAFVGGRLEHLAAGWAGEAVGEDSGQQ